MAGCIANRFVFYPARYPEGLWEVQAQLHAADLWLRTADGVRIHSWWMPHEGPWVTLYLHGNAGNITHRYPIDREILVAGSAVLAPDYRGYGKSAGRPSERGLYRDADAAYDHLLRAGYRPHQVVLHGESLGTAVAVDLASRRPCAGLVLEAPFTSAADVAATIAPLIGRLPIWGFNSIAKIGRVRAPLLIVHGDRDRLIPVRMGQALFAAAHPPKSLWLVPGAGHNDIWETAGPDYPARLAAFYASLAAAPPG
ncbi:MAG TPA: alpha/beta hydrolase [Bryobacteraceae bacterium]|nr:alpha/beta hydrolase [Bryobacteraceae bacterium]